MLNRANEGLDGGIRAAILLVLTGGAWLVSAHLATPDMRQGVLSGGGSPMPMDGQMGMGGSTSMGLGGFITAWAVMMAAMMLPSMTPLAARIAGRSSGAAALLLASYLLVWSVVGGAAYLVVQVLQDWFPTGSATALRSGAALLIVAGLYQLAPLKQACLHHCRSPREVGAVAGPEYLGAVRAGLRLGAACLGSSWPLMLVLLLAGMMNLGWMALIAALVFIEKVLPGGEAVSKGVGWGLVGCGVLLLLAPHTLPSLS